MAVLDDMKFVRIDDRARLPLEAETEKGKQPVVEGNSDSHVLDRDLNVIDYRFHLLLATLDRFRRRAGDGAKGVSPDRPLSWPARRRVLLHIAIQSR